MYVPFEELPESARVWVYPLSREASELEAGTIEKNLLDFCSQWGAHGSALKTSYRLIDNHFLILSVDEQAGGASGCSIDSSVHTLKSLHQKLGIDFFDRSNVPFYINDKIVLYPVSKLKELFASGTLKKETLSFNTLAANKGELERSWVVPAGQTWLARYLPKTALA